MKLRRKGESRDKERMSSTIEVGRATEEEEGTKDHTYDVVDEESSTEKKAALYQELDVGTQDYVSVYTQLGGGTYQELDPRGKKEEHHYQTADGGKT